MPVEKFSAESARLAGIRSGAVRRAKNHKTVAEQALEDTMTLKGLLNSLLAAHKCEKCGRSGPRNTTEYIDVVKTLLALNSEILNRIKGKPSTETSAHKFGSVAEYRKATLALEESEAESLPDDLPPAPNEGS
jgi:hypothetical protein